MELVCLLLCVLLSMEPWAAAKKNFQLVWRYHQLVSGFLAKGHLPRVSHQSHQSLMIRVIMRRSWGCAQISWHLPYSRGKPQKTTARRPSDEGAVGPVIASNGVPFLQMRSVGSHSTSGREKEGNKERTRRVLPHVMIAVCLFFCNPWKAVNTVL